MFGRIDYRIAGLIKEGLLESELALIDEKWNMWRDSFRNFNISGYSKNGLCDAIFIQVPSVPSQ
jgi:hypothetical protein